MRMRVLAFDYPDDKDYPDFESYIQAWDDLKAQTKAKILQWLDEGVKEFSDETGTHFGVVSPDPYEDGVARISWYDPNGFSGHISVKSEDQLVDELVTGLKHGLMPATGSLDKFSETEEWRLGMEHVRQVMERNKELKHKSVRAWFKACAL